MKSIIRIAVFLSIIGLINTTHCNQDGKRSWQLIPHSVHPNNWLPKGWTTDFIFDETPVVPALLAGAGYAFNKMKKPSASAACILAALFTTANMLPMTAQEDD